MGVSKKRTANPNLGKLGVHKLLEMLNLSSVFQLFTLMKHFYVFLFALFASCWLMLASSSAKIVNSYQFYVYKI